MFFIISQNHPNSTLHEASMNVYWTHRPINYPRNANKTLQHRYTCLENVFNEWHFEKTCSTPEPRDMAPPWGLSTPRAPKECFSKQQTNKWNGHGIGFFLSYGFAAYFAWAKLYTFPMFPAYSQAPQASKTTSKIRLNFSHVSQKRKCLFFWWALGAMVPWCHSGAIEMLTRYIQ